MRTKASSKLSATRGRWAALCFEPIDIAALVYFRIVFGALMLWELGRYWVGRQVDSLWVVPEFHFKYFGFGWVQAPPGNGMYLLMVVLMASAAGLALGLFYRVSAIVFALGFTWLFLIDAAQYLNHFYLICLLGFVCILLPGNRRLAVDSLRKPALRSDIAPAWTLWLLRVQIAIVYFYGGIAKLDADWLGGEPVRSWLKDRAEGTRSSLFGSEWTVSAICYGGLLFDLLIVPLLLWRKTRLIAFVVAIAFHFTNNWLFSIGVFPWLGLALTALFFPPDWPRHIASNLRLRWTGCRQAKRAAFINRAQFGFRHRRWVGAFLGAYLAWQVFMPLRHCLYPGAVSWTEEGHLFSWHMKLRSKSGETQFFLLDPATQEVWLLDSLAYLSLRQQRKMNGHPDLIMQFAHHIAALMAEKGRANVHVHVLARAQLNARPPALLIDPEVNLAAVQRSLRPASWILPLGNSRPNPDWYHPVTQSVIERGKAPMVRAN